MRDRNRAPANQTSSIEGGSLMPAPRLLLVVLLGLLSLSVTCSAAAPQVVATVPELGAGAVDPQSSEIRVTFDQPMDPSSYSWVTLGSRFPEVAGDPYWADEFTAVLPVTLEPGRDYWLLINSPLYGGFRVKRARQPFPTSWSSGRPSRAGAPASRVLCSRPEVSRRFSRSLRS